MNKDTRSRVAMGGMLIVLGVGLYLMRAYDFGHSIVLTLLGGLFLAAYLRWRNNGMLIPAGILLGLGLGYMFRDRLEAWGEPLNIGLGAGFIFIYVAALIYERESHWWPLIPGVVLLLLGFQAWRGFREFLFSDGWPLIIVAVGVLILLGAIGRPKGRRGKSDG